MMPHPIQTDPRVMHGTPCFAGTRVPVKSLFDYIEHGHPLENFYSEFPSVSRSHVESVLRLARERVLRDAMAA